VDFSTVFARGERGDLPAIRAAAAEWERDQSAEAAAGHLALRALLSVYGEGSPPGAAEFSRRFDDSAAGRAIASTGLALVERMAVLAFDAELLRRLIGVHERLVEGCDPSAAVELTIARLWLAVLAGPAPGDAETAGGAFESASALRQARLVVETTILRSLVAVGTGDVPAAIELARRAMRMARTEEFPLEQYLAALTLARLRRRTGRSHLALHILSALEKAAPPAFQPWVAWESLCAGRLGSVADSMDSPGPARDAASAATALVRAALDGQRPAFDQAAGRLLAAAAGFADVSAEAHSLVGLLDGHGRPYDPDIAEWRGGDKQDAPRGLGGVGLLGEADPMRELPVAIVFASPHTASFRILRPGRALLPPARDLEIVGQPPRSSRADVGLAVLAMAGEKGLDRTAFFQRVYGFPFRPQIHQELLDMLIVRMRRRLDESGEIQRDAHTRDIVLRLREPLLIPDSRCVLPLPARILRVLAQRGELSAADAALALRISVRAVHAALRELVDDGACMPDRDRQDERRVRYHVVDTTFTQVARAT
jgi:hypothetical protein